MSRVAKSAVINGNADQIMNYIADVNNHPAFIGPLKSIANINGDPKKAGTSWDWTFVMAGVEFSGRAETVSYQEFVNNDGWKGAREKGMVRAEEKEYVVQDGDVLLFRFNV